MEKETIGHISLRGADFKEMFKIKEAILGAGFELDRMENTAQEFTISRVVGKKEGAVVSQFSGFRGFKP